MDYGDILLTFAEVSVAFAGFSGVVAVFGRRDPSSWSFADRIRFYSLVATSLPLLLLCILPFGLFAIHLSEESVWRVLSALVVSYIVVGNVWFLRRIRAASPAERADITAMFLRILHGVHVLILLLNVYNVVLVAEFGPFLVTLILLLMQSGFLFARMLVSGFGEGRAS